MIDIDFTNIDNAKLIGRLLPFWVRGRKLSLFLQALLSPLKYTHTKFQRWALEIYIANHITSQKLSLEWYLKFKLKSHFINENDSFFITNGIDGSASCCSTNVWRNGLHWDNELKWGIDENPLINTNIIINCLSAGKWDNDMYWNNGVFWDNEDNGLIYVEDYLDSEGQTNVFAPAIVDTVTYNHQDYERDIRNIMAKYMINFNKINIIIADL